MPASPAQAVDWLERAAADRYAPAEMLLGKMAFQGKGMAPDNRTAAIWLARAGLHGAPEAEAALCSLRSTEQGIPTQEPDVMDFFQLIRKGGREPCSE